MSPLGWGCDVPLCQLCLLSPEANPGAVTAPGMAQLQPGWRRDSGHRGGQCLSGDHALGICLKTELYQLCAAPRRVIRSLEDTSVSLGQKPAQQWGWRFGGVCCSGHTSASKVDFIWNSFMLG